MNNIVAKLVVVGVLGGIGCGDKSPSEKCEDLISVVCDRAVDCISGASGMHSACVRAFDDMMFCASTKSVGPSYDRCMDLLDQASCQALFPTDSGSGEPTIELPVECNGVLSTGTARGHLGAPATALPPGPLGAVLDGARGMTE